MEFIVIFWIVTAGFTMAVAGSKRRSELTWLGLGIVFGPIALLSVGLMPELPRAFDAPTPKTHVKCPDCAELVLREARVCKHCGLRLTPQ